MVSCLAAFKYTNLRNIEELGIWGFFESKGLIRWHKHTCIHCILYYWIFWFQWFGGKKWQQPMIWMISMRKILMNDYFLCFALMLDWNHIDLTVHDWAWLDVAGHQEVITSNAVKTFIASISSTKCSQLIVLTQWTMKALELPGSFTSTKNFLFLFHQGIISESRKNFCGTDRFLWYPTCKNHEYDLEKA